MRREGLGDLSGVSKTELRAAVDAIDNWIESAQGASPPSVGFNAALPQPFRSQATVAQKTLLFCWVAMRRAGVLTTRDD
jgi:hypothetical protein